jgi:hypothetical protein
MKFASWAAILALLLTTYAQLAHGQISAPPEKSSPLASPSAPDLNTNQSVQIPEDLDLLVGKKVIVGRLNLCAPKSFNVNLAHSGKLAKVISYVRSNKYTLDQNIFNRMPPSTQDLFRDLQKGGMLVFEFEDATRLDTCGDLGHGAIAAQLDLAPGETIDAIVDHRTKLTAAFDSKPETCPASISGLSSGVSFSHLLVDALTTSEFEQRLDAATHNGQNKHYLDIKFRNDSDTRISGIEFGSVYSNRMGDETTSSIFILQNSKLIDPKTEYKSYVMDRTQVSQSGTGEVKVFINRIRFEDGSVWHDNGTRSCSRSAKSE